MDDPTMFDVLETAGFAELALATAQCDQTVEILKRAYSHGRDTGDVGAEQRWQALGEIIDRLETAQSTLREACRDAGVEGLFDRARIWDRVGAAPG